MSCCLILFKLLVGDCLFSSRIMTFLVLLRMKFFSCVKHNDEYFAKCPQSRRYIWYNICTGGDDITMLECTQLI